MKQISTKQLKHLEGIRNNKSAHIKETLTKAYKELLEAKGNPTRYKLHKQTKIAYITINKYFDEVINEAR